MGLKSMRKYATLSTLLTQNGAITSALSLLPHRIETMKGVFLGSGTDGMSYEVICSTVMSLTGKPEPECSVLFIGTATYDLPGPRERQTAIFREAGCTISDLPIACRDPSPGEMRERVGSADIVVVGGGNTLFMVDRWRRIGLDAILREAMRRGTVLAGGSAGAICWFDGGHSDSMDPDTYRAAKLSESEPRKDVGKDDDETTRRWEYIRADGLGFLPGLVCPHHDKMQSNGLLRARDFNSMLKRHSGERGICIDHWAGLVIDGDDY